MFEGLKGMASLAGLMKDMPKFKARLDETKRRLAESTVESETGGGAVRVVANGMMEVISVEVDPALLAALVDGDREEDRGMAQDLIAAAVNAALRKSRELAQQALADGAAEMGLPVPPGLEDLLS